MSYEQFNENFRQRTKQFAVDVIKFYGEQKKSEPIKILGDQLLRASTSVASNFRAATRARSKKEFFSKICVVVEEADETQFWLELMDESELVKREQVEPLQHEASEILAVVTSIKSKLRSN